MKRQSDPPEDPAQLRQKLIGLGKQSLRKSYYPQLQSRLEELERFRALLDNSKDAILLISTTDLQVVDANDTTGRMLARPVSELIGSQLNDLVQFNSAASLPDLLAKYPTGESPVAEGMCHFIGEEGQRLPIEFTARKVSFAGEGYIVFVGRDIRDRLLAEAALRESEERLQRLASNLPNAMVYQLATHPNGEKKFLYVSANIERLYEVSVEAVLADPATIYDQVLPEFRAALEASETQAMRSMSPFNFEVQCRLPSGMLRWFNLSSTPRLLADGTVLWDGVSVDVTQRKQAEEAIRANEKRLHAILEASADPLVVYDDKGLATFVNQAFTRVFGWQPQEVIGQRIPFVPEDEAPMMQEAITRLFVTGGPVAMETKRLTKNGRLLSIALRAAGIPGQSGGITGMVVNLTDVTQTKLLEAQLRQSQKMEAIGTLAGGIAHDFNNILGAVIGYSEMALEATKAKQDPTTGIKKILQAGERASELVKQILTISRKVEVDLKPLNLNTEVNNVVEILGKTIPKMISIETYLAQDLKPVLADTNQVEQILLNLGSNAQDAMPEGGRLAIDTQNVTLDHEYCMQHLDVWPGDYVLLQVSDNGTGMNEQTKEHIFEPFFTTKAVGKGTGLGLSTVYGIVKGFGGQICCYSEPGLGTTFKIYLPVYLQDVSPSTEALRQPQEIPGGKETILLVDDEDALRDLGSQTLSWAGYSVLTAKNGEEALEVYQVQGPIIGLVIMDLGMPRMGGSKALKAILKINPSAKVMIASGYAANGSVKEALQAGAVGYVAKPFHKTELLATVRSMLDKK